MCGHAKIQAPGAKWADGKMPQEVETALTKLEEGGEQTEQLRFPLSVSEGRNELDKTGSACTAGAYTRSTFQLNLSALYGIGGARRGCVARVKGALGGVQCV